MNVENISLLFQKLDQIIFLLQSLMVASCFLCGFVSLQLIIHAKNQRNLL